MIEKTENKFGKAVQINNSWLIFFGIALIGLIAGYMVLSGTGSSSGLAGKALQGSESSQLSAGAMQKAKPQSAQEKFNSFAAEKKNAGNYQNYTVNCSGAIISDATHDGVVTTTDALIIFNYVLGLGEVEVVDGNTCCMDFDGSQTITTSDALGAFQIALGMMQSPGYCPVWCSDSDQGIDIFTAGQVIVDESEEVFNDSCLGLQGVIEYYCDAGYEAAYSLEYCPHEGPYYEDYCFEGACMPIDYQCSDTDGGMNIYEAGTVEAYAYFNGEEMFHFELEDECQDVGRLKEWFCDEDSHQNAEEINCPEGYTCRNGECTDAFSCSDTDGGINFGVKGTASQWNEAQQQFEYFTDYCYGYLAEYYCQNDAYAGMTIHPCAECIEGACQT